MTNNIFKIANTTFWILFAFCAIVVGFYPAFYFLLDRKFSLLAFKDKELLKDVLWNISFYTHIIAGGLALLIGWLQFSNKLRLNSHSTHRNVGKLYIFLALFGSVSGIHLAFFAQGGNVARLGFASLGIIWFCTSLISYLRVRQGNIVWHRKMALLSYSACFSAVTLRLWLQLFIKNGMDFFLAYQIVSWLCWIPNVLIAVVLSKKSRTVC